MCDFALIQLGSHQERPRRGPGNQIYLIANPATTIHQEHVPRTKFIPLLDNRCDAFDYNNNIFEHVKVSSHPNETSLQSYVANITAKKKKKKNKNEKRKHYSLFI